MRSKIVTWIGLACGAGGIVLTFLGQHGIGEGLAGVGLLLSSVGKSLMGE